MTPPGQANSGDRTGRQGATGRRGAAILVAAAFVSFMLSPVTAVFALVLGPLLALVVWPFALLGSVGARQVLFLAAGVILGALPYFVAGVVIALRG